MPAITALDSGDPDSDDESRKADKLAARAARFSQKLPGNRYKQLEEMRAKERKVFEDQGLIKTGKIELDEAVDMRGTCERMCSEYEREFREYTREIHPFEAGPNKRMDPDKAVAAYSRSDAGAGHGDSAILPSDLRTPVTLVHTLDYLFSEVMPIQPPSTSDRPPSARKALGYSAGFIRDRTRAIRKEFAMQSSWGHDEAIASFERIARWHILCLRELQEATGTNTDMHIDSAELGRCFTSLRQHYNDRREELGVNTPCANEPEFRAYMLIFDLANKSVSIPTAELPIIILDHPLVKLAWEIRKAAQRNFDSQKEGSKLNAELGANLITRFVRILRQGSVPYVMACLVEVRLRDMRRSALRALTRAYPRLRNEPVRVNEAGEVVERRMLLFSTLDRILGCEEQDAAEPAYDDVDNTSTGPVDEDCSIVRRFGLDVYEDESGPVGALINLGSLFNDNRDAPYTKRWRMVTEKRGKISFVNVVSGKSGVLVNGASALAPTDLTSRKSPFSPMPTTPSFSFPAAKKPAAPSPSFPLTTAPQPAFSFSFNKATAVPPIETTNVHSAPPLIPLSPLIKPQSAAGPPSTPPTVAKLPAFCFIAPTPPAEAATTRGPLFSKPTFFSAIPVGPSVSTETPVSPPRVIIQLPPQSNQSPVSATPIRDTEKLSKSVARQDFASTELERRRQRQALPLLADRLIGEIVQQVFGEITADLLRTAKQVAAARTCAKAKTRRKENILLWSEWTYEVLRAEAIHRILEEAVLGEVRRRFLVRRAIRRWRDWASRTREAREIAFKEREETFDRLRSMGLGEALSFGDASMPAGPSDPAKSKGPLDEFEVDIALQQAQRTTSLLHAPSTFLAAIEQHIAPHLSPSTSSIASTFSANSSRNDGHAWHTLISPASDSACAPDATDWLISKFIPESSEQHEQDMMSFETTVVGRYDELPCSHDVGLVVFEASLRTWASHKASENIADAQDRMAVLVKTATRLENRYTPGFIILTWEDETLQEVVERLDIADDVALFEHKTILSLEYSEDLDVRFDKALEEVILGFHEKERIVLRHQDVMSRLFPSWERLLEASSLVLEQRPTDAHSALRVFKAGIEGIKVVARIIVDGLSKKVVIASSFHSISLQDFTDSSPSDMHTAVEAIDGYLHKELFQGLDDVSLILAPLHQAALQSKPLPLVVILQSLASLVFGELCLNDTVLNWWTAGSTDEHLEAFFDFVSGEYEQAINCRIATITAAPKPSPQKSPSKSLKRSRVSDAPQPAKVESKMAKNARLRRAMEAVERTMGQMGNGDLGTGVFVCGLDTPHTYDQ